jgi:hypothetical protein
VQLSPSEKDIEGNDEDDTKYKNETVNRIKIRQVCEEE